MKRARLFMLSALLTGCAGLIAVPDLTFDEGAAQGTADGSTPADGSSSGSPDGAAPDGATPIDGGVPTCTLTPAQMQADAKNCGRCGHDCLGGACNAGKCESVVVASGLACPVGLVTDADHVYVATRGDGAVRRIAKVDGQVTPMSTGQKETRGLALGKGTDGKTRLFWSNTNGAGDGGDAYYYGGIYGCTLPACSDKFLVTEASYPGYFALSGDDLYFAETNAFRIARVAASGGSPTTVADRGTKPWSVATDGTSVFFQEFGGVYRVQQDGGSPTKLGSTDPRGIAAFVTLDADRVYWASSDEIAPERGHVASILKSGDPGSLVEYSISDDVRSIGVAVDDAMVYWTNEGPFDSTAGAFSVEGQVRACPKAGCGGAPTVLAQGLNAPGAIVVDGDALYFLTYGSSDTSSNGELRRIAKP